jgi:DNA-binding CsgD family transcriptional regulator/tetratricopeptide (TPR) repeat protein
MMSMAVACLLERDEPLAQLMGLATSAPGGGRMVMVTGEAGVGKSALVGALAERVKQRVWMGWCERLFTPRPLGPIVDIATRAGGPLTGAIGHGAPVHVVFPALLAELVNRPTVLVIEDLHWADEATLDVVVLLARRVSASRSLVVVTARDDELGADHQLRLVLGQLAEAGAQRLRLRPLSLQAVSELAASVEVDAVALFDRTGGNAFFVTEILAAGGSELPPSVRDAVLARVALLDTEARGLLQALSIVSGVAPVGLVRAVGGVHVDRLDTCLASGMLVARDEGIEFRHELARAAIAEEIGPLRRVELHRAALAWLRGHGADAAQIAHYAEEARDEPVVAMFAPLAAEQATTRGAHREAAAQYARALRWSDQLAGNHRAELLERGAHEHYLIDRFDESIDWLERAAAFWENQGDNERRAEVLCKLSSIQRCGGRATDAWANGLAAVALLETGPITPAVAEAHANVAMLALNANRVDDGLPPADRALTLARTWALPRVTAHALNTKGFLQTLAGDDNGIVLIEESLELALAEGLDEQVGRAYIHLADLAQRYRRFDLADRFRNDGTRYCAEHSLDLWSRYLAVYHARIDLDRGQWNAAVAGIHSVLAEPGTPLARVIALAVLGLVRARRGDPGVWATLDEARTLAERSGELQFRAPVAAARSEAAWLTGRPESIDDETAPVLRDCVDLGATWWAGEIAWWRRTLGIDEYPPPSTAEPWRHMLDGHIPAAAAAWQRIGCPYEHAIAAASGEPEEMLGALETLDKLGARAAVAHVQRRLRSAGTTPRRGPRRTTRANPAGLTTREIEVLQLLAADKSDREIAEALVVSIKTASHHVSAILNKLSVSNRRAAVRRAQDLGIPRPTSEPNAGVDP